MKAALFAAALLFAFTAATLVLPEADATTTHFCSGATTPNCYYMLCWNDWQDEYGYYHCQYAFYWPCQYCVPI